MKRQVYKTKQRDQIFAAIESFENSHFTAADVVMRLYERGTPVSQSTVYRALEHMYEESKLQKYEKGGQEGACYQRVESVECSAHFHLRCSECGELIHMECDYMRSLTEHILQHHGFNIDVSKTIFYGCCEKCERRKNA